MKIVKCFKGSSSIWAKAHRLEWDCYEESERAFKGKYWAEDNQEILRSRIMGTGNFMGHQNNNIMIYAVSYTHLYNYLSYFA